jgi:hypothetical protein
MCLGALEGAPREQNALMSQNEHPPGLGPQSASSPANTGTYDANRITALEGL